MALKKITIVRTRNIFVKFALIACVVSMATPSVAAGPASLARGFSNTIHPISEGEPTLAPFAHVKFCMEQPDQCAVSGGQQSMTLDRDRLRELSQVNSDVNDAIRPVNDPKGKDDWNIDVAAGDCEDYALTKRERLIRLGWSSWALRIAVAVTATGEGHAVLVAKTTKGDLVLDNRFNEIKDWQNTDLLWVKIQSGQNPKLWFDLEKHDRTPILLVSETFRSVAQSSHSGMSVAANAGNNQRSNVRSFQAEKSEHSSIKIPKGAILRVRDGATFDFEGNQYRLAGVAPTALNRLCENAAGRRYACGLKNTKVLSDLLRSDMVECSVNGFVQGRRLARCLIGNQDIATLISNNQ